MNTDGDYPVTKKLLAVFLISLLCSLVIYLTHTLTAEQIEINSQQASIEILETVLPLAHDNNLFSDSKVLEDRSTTVYRARLKGKDVGLVFMPLSARGYNDKIIFAMGLSYDGTLTGVRVIAHRETRGLGDGIDASKSEWIYNFDQRSLGNTKHWAVRNDGGDIDQLSGATISARGLVTALEDNLEYYRANRENLYQ